MKKMEERTQREQARADLLKREMSAKYF